MNIFLDPEFESYLQKQIQSGRYASIDEVVRAGLRLLREREEAADGDPEYQEYLRRAVADGIRDVDEGRYGPVDPLEMLEEIRRQNPVPGSVP